MISFIIPAKNEEDYIGSCLTSILRQEIDERYEIIVVDNGSVDSTVAKAKQYFPQAIIASEVKPGTSAARQKGFLESRGEILIFLDADARLPDKNWLKRVLQKISQPNLVALSSHYRYYGVPGHQKLLQTLGTFLFVYPWIFLTNILFRHSCHMIGGMMAIKKQALSQAGGFGRETEFFGDETLIAKRLYALGKIVVSPKFWVHTSGRRYKSHGMVRTVYRYVLNYFWALFTGQPYHRTSS